MNPPPVPAPPGRDTACLAGNGAGFILAFHAVADGPCQLQPFSGSCHGEMGLADVCPRRVVRALFEAASPRGGIGPCLGLASGKQGAGGLCSQQPLSSPPRPLEALGALVASGVSCGLSCACQASEFGLVRLRDVWLSVSTRAFHRGKGCPVCLGVAVSELCLLCPS